MRNSKKLTGWIFGGVAFWGISATAWGAAAPTPSQILTFKPKQDGIQAVMPTAEEEASLIENRLLTGEDSFGDISNFTCS